MESTTAERLDRLGDFTTTTRVVPIAALAIVMGAILGGTMLSPLTAVVFALELSHDVTVILPLLLAVTIAPGFTMLALRRSILTEKISRRGYHMSREYSIDPLEIIFAREVVRTSVVALPADASPELVAATLGPGTNVRHEQRLFPVVDGGRRVVGVITRTALRAWLGADARPSGQMLGDVARGRPLLAYADETLKIIVYRMAETGLIRLPIVRPPDERARRHACR